MPRRSARRCAIGALAAAGVRRGRVLLGAACRGARDGKRASAGWRRSRPRSDLRVEPSDDRRRSCAPAGADVEVSARSRTTTDAHRAALERGLAADVLVTSGGVSMGPHDLVRRVAAELGVEEVFWGVAVKPGKPLSFGVRGETLVFGLPGNPVSSLVGALVFVRPALLARQGRAAPSHGTSTGRPRSRSRRNSQRDEFVRARRCSEEDGVSSSRFPARSRT